jgi:hypothetical protein
MEQAAVSAFILTAFALRGMLPLRQIDAVDRTVQNVTK